MGKCAGEEVLGEVKVNKGGAKRDIKRECLVDGVVGED